MMDDKHRRGFGQAGRGQAQLLPGQYTAKEFGKVYVKRDGDRLNVEFTVWIDDSSEGWQTGVALDASSSMEPLFGRQLLQKQTIPKAVIKHYKKQGWVKNAIRDGREVDLYYPEAFKDAIQRGYYKWSDNVVEPLARDFIAYLAGELDSGGGTTVIYWACGEDGTSFEALGKYTEEQCRNLEIKGPRKIAFGNATHLLPALKYFADTFISAPRALFIFITDGRLDDLEAVKAYTTQLAKQIGAGKRNLIKCVLIGIGNKIDETQMEQLDDLDTGTEIDIWDHKIATELRALSEIVVELVDESKIVAPMAIVYDDQGKVIERFTDSLPAKATFTMPAAAKFFELEVGGRRIRQSVEAS